MITPSDVVNHLATYLPSQTDLFSVMVGVDSASNVYAAGVNTITIDTTTAHGLNPGDVVTFSSGKVQNTLSDASALAGQVKFSTSVPHDQTDPRQLNDEQNVILSGFVSSNATWNGSNAIQGVPNRESFVLDYPDGLTSPPVISGNEYLIESRAGLSGVHDVASTPTSTSFTVVISGAAQFPDGSIVGLNISRAVRIAATVDASRAEQIYTKHGTSEAWAFVIMADVDVSRDRHTLSDAVANHTAQDFNRIDLLQNFDIVVFMPVENDLSGARAHELLYGEIFTALVKTLKGFAFSDSTSHVKFVVVPLGHGAGVYNTGFISEVYEWQLPTALTYQDGFDMQPDVAFRDIHSTWNVFSDNAAQLALNINLDEEPL